MARFVTGRLCDISWVNPTFVYQFGVLLVGFITTGLPIIKGYKGILMFAIIYGVGDGIIVTTMNTLLMFSVDEKYRAAAIGLGSSVISLGIAGGPPLAGKYSVAPLVSYLVHSAFSINDQELTESIAISPTDCMLVHRRVTPQSMSPLTIDTTAVGGEV